jgi:Family of unknown function (DUF5906)
VTLDLGDAGPQSGERREAPPKGRYVRWRDIKQAVRGHEGEIFDALDISWRPARNQKHVHCPFPEHPDENPSWRWDSDRERFFCSCSSGSVFDVIQKIIGIDFDEAKVRAAELIGSEDLICDPEKSRPQGLTLNEYAEAKKLLIERLQEIGIRQSPYGQIPASVKTPYFRLNGNPSIRFRVNLNGNKKKRHFWREGDKACLYGEWLIPQFRSIGYAIIVEGESDCQTCWFNGEFPAVGVPGAGLWNEKRDAHLFDDIPVIFANIERNSHGEPDEGGKILLSRLASSSIAPRVRLIKLPAGIKDPSALYLKDPAGFPAAFKAALDAAQPIPPEIIKAAQDQTPPPKSDGVSLDDFWAYMPMHNYIFAPARATWPPGSVNSRIPPIPTGDDEEISATVWLDRHKPVEQMTWAPGLPMIVRDRLIIEGGWINRSGVSCFNLYQPPTIEGGDPAKADKYIAHLQYIYPNDADHILNWFAHRVQRPHEKLNHALVLGGKQGIGKDTLLEPVKHAIGPWNFQEASPVQILGRFNGYLKSVILRISEARDLGDFDRFQFYDHTKSYIASPPDVHRIDEKNLREYYIPNCCAVIITTNHRTDGIYLPPDDRRHYVAWSEKEKEDPKFQGSYWNDLWAYYDNGGIRHVVAYLKSRDISKFNPKAPPPKTDAFWAIVDNGRSPEEPELADALDALRRPNAVTIANILSAANGGFFEWLADRKNRRAIPHKMEICGYVPVRNPDRDTGLWVIADKRQVVYAKAELSEWDRMAAARDLVAGKPHPWQAV